MLIRCPRHNVPQDTIVLVELLGPTRTEQIMEGMFVLLGASVLLGRPLGPLARYNSNNIRTCIFTRICTQTFISTHTHRYVHTYMHIPIRTYADPFPLSLSCTYIHMDLVCSAQSVVHRSANAQVHAMSNPNHTLFCGSSMSPLYLMYSLPHTILLNLGWVFLPCRNDGRPDRHCSVEMQCRLLLQS